jgi:hypothetical protein
VGCRDIVVHERRADEDNPRLESQAVNPRTKLCGTEGLEAFMAGVVVGIVALFLAWIALGAPAVIALGSAMRIALIR